MTAIFTIAPEPKQMIRDRTSYPDMSDEDRKNYESQVVSFFLLNLPAGSRAESVALSRLHGDINNYLRRR